MLYKCGERTRDSLERFFVWDVLFVIAGLVLTVKDLPIDDD